MFTAVPIMIPSTTVLTTSTASSTITTTATSMSYCQTVSSSPCPLNWFADVISSLPKVSSIRSTTSPSIPKSTKESQSQTCPIQPICEKANNHFSIQTQTPYNLIKRRTVGTQFKSVTLKDQCTQTTDIKIVLPEKAFSTNDTLNSTLLSMGSDDSRDQDWEPEIESEDISMDCDDTTKRGKDTKETKYIVFESCLDELINQCKVCGSKTSIIKKCSGTLLICDISCLTCGHFESNEVSSSYAMELEGLKRALNWITETQKLQITDIVTDRHSSVKKFMRDVRPMIGLMYGMLQKESIRKLLQQERKKAVKRSKIGRDQ